jgi:hypothetical protein
MTFHSVGNVIIPTDEVLFFKWLLHHQPEDLTIWQELNQVVAFGWTSLDIILNVPRSEPLDILLLTFLWLDLCLFFWFK